MRRVSLAALPECDGVPNVVTKVMSLSVKPWLAEQQPSRRGGVLQVTTGQALPVNAIAPAGQTGTDVMTLHRAVGQLDEPFVVRRHIDLMRVTSALCRASR